MILAKNRDDNTSTKEHVKIQKIRQTMRKSEEDLKKNWWVTRKTNAAATDLRASKCGIAKTTIGWVEDLAQEIQTMAHMDKAHCDGGRREGADDPTSCSTYIHTYMHTHMHIYVCVCMYVFEYVYVCYVYYYIVIYMYTYTIEWF
jgi:hypothetical protein